jgi:hypothetical protein
MPTNDPPALCTDTPPQTWMPPHLHSLPFLPARFANPPLPVNLFCLSPTETKSPNSTTPQKTSAAALSLSLSLSLSLCLSLSLSVSRTLCLAHRLPPSNPNTLATRSTEHDFANGKDQSVGEAQAVAGTQFGEAMGLVGGCWDGRKRCSHREGAGAQQASEENFNVRRQKRARLSHADSSPVKWAPCFVGPASPRRPSRGEVGTPSNPLSSHGRDDESGMGTWILEFSARWSPEPWMLPPRWTLAGCGRGLKYGRAPNDLATWLWEHGI